MDLVIDNTMMALGQWRPQEQTGVYRSTVLWLTALLDQLPEDYRVRCAMAPALSRWHRQGCDILSACGLGSYYATTLWDGARTLEPLTQAFDTFDRHIIQPMTGQQLSSRWVLSPWWMEQCRAQPRMRALKGKTAIYHSPFFPFGAGPWPSTVTRCLTLHDTIPLDYPQWVSASARARLQQTLKTLRPEDWIMTPTQAVKNRLLYWSDTVSPEQIHVVPWAPDPRFLPEAPPPKNAVASSPFRWPYVLTVGTDEPRKNLYKLIKAFEGLLQRPGCKDLRLVLAGPVSDRFLGEALKMAPLVADRVVSVGHVSNPRLVALYQGAQVVAFPSLAEGFGLPPLEAMACGVPVVTSTDPAVREVVGHAAVSVDATDRSCLIDGLHQVITHPAQRQALIEAGYERANQYSWAQTAQLTQGLYEQMRP